MTFSVLFVCTGNICRSPLGKRLLESRLNDSTPMRVCSAGTAALVGRSIDAASAIALSDLGVDGCGHVARQLTKDTVDQADLILTAESAHRSAIIRADPPTFRKTFTMREFGRLGAALVPMVGPPTPDRLRARVEQVADQRGWVEAPALGADEIGDPFGASSEVARQTAVEISGAVDAILSALGLPMPVAPD